MKKRNFILAGLGIATLLAAGLVSCNGASSFEYALVTDVGDIDDHSFNQTSWEAVKEFAEANKKTYAYYRPTADSDDARIASINQAIQRGAKVVVCPGYLFETAVYTCQVENPEVKFVLLDGNPHTADYSEYLTAPNSVGITYQEELAGFAAGYAAVKDGYRKLGFCGGMAVPAVQRFGSGYLQGANEAAEELSLGDASIEVNYYYAGAFAATPDATAKMKTWYGAGTEVVFACGGKVYQSVKEACDEKEGKKWIGVDTDQYNDDPERILTSAVKGLKESVKSALQLYMDGNWSEIGGSNFTLGLNTVLANLAAKDYVGLPTEHWNFAKFSKEDYAKLLKDIGDGEIEVDDDTNDFTSDTPKLKINWESSYANVA